MADQVLDAKGLNCPMPIIKTKKMIKSMATGQVLQVDSTDPGSVQDMEAFCRVTGNELLSSNESDNVFSFEIKVTG